MTLAKQLQLARAHTEAREHALRNVQRRLESVLRELQDRNYGLAERDLQHIIVLMDDEHGTPQVIEDAITLMGDRMPASSLHPSD